MGFPCPYVAPIPPSPLSGGTLDNYTFTGTATGDVYVGNQFVGPSRTHVNDGIIPASNSGTNTWIFRYNNTNFAVLEANTGWRLGSDQTLAWSSSAGANGTLDNSIGRAGANSLRFGESSATTTSRTEINKAVTAFTNAAAKTVFTVTVPNAAHHAVLEVEIQGALGAGGAIGAGEAMATNTYKIAIVRTAGVATVATATAATHAVAVAVAGAATVTATAAVSAMSGAVGATQTFTIDVTITKSGGLSDSHTCLAYAKLVNANATGITIA